MGNLNGNVGPGFSISLTTSDGTPVTSLGAGTYAIHVVDQARTTTSTSRAPA